MKISTCPRITQESMPSNDQEWCMLNKTLLVYIKNCLYTYHVIHWLGAEPEIASDVLQETYLRVLRFTRSNEERGSSIDNFEAFCKTTAKRYILDMYRKDKRFVGSLDDLTFFATSSSISISEDPAELAIEDITLYSSMLTFSQIVKRFPEMQKTALLIDLARKTNFDDESPSPLERAMDAVGISLRMYNRALPHDPILRSRHTALVCLAYKRLRLAFLHDTLPQLNVAA